MSSTKEITTSSYKTGIKLWQANDGAFEGWTLNGTELGEDGVIRLDPENAQHEATGNKQASVGEATGPITQTAFAFTEAIVSWNAETPEGTWIEAQLRACSGGEWTRWYSMGVWTSARGEAGATRRSVDGQKDDAGRVSTDTLLLSKPAEAAQVRVKLFGVEGAIPSVRNMALAVSTTPTRPEKLAPGDASLWDHTLDVPQHSQMVYPDGGNVWCSPTAVSMVLAFWGKGEGTCEDRVRHAVAGVYDAQYEGHGNWPFNAAYAAAQGMEAYAVRFSTLADTEKWIAAGVPVVLSYAWKDGELSGAPVAHSDGHLGVLCGFSKQGDPVVNDPAAASNDAVRRLYKRAEFETLWLKHSGGAAYLIYPPGWATPDLPLL